MGWPSYYENLIEKLIDASDSLSSDLAQLHDEMHTSHRQESIRNAAESIQQILHEVLELATDPDVKLSAHCKTLENQIKGHQLFLGNLAETLTTSNSEKSIAVELESALTRSREQQSCIKELTKEVERLNKIITDMHADRFLMLKEFQRVENGAAQKKYR